MNEETRQTNNNNNRYWCHICNAEVQIYMAPDPTCQRCNEQFIEELQADDDPRAFLSGQPVHEEEEGEHPRTFRRQIFLPDGGSAQFFSISQGNNRGGDVGDDIFQFFAPRNTTTEENNEQEPNMNNVMQSILSNLMNTTQQQENNENSTEPNNRPLLFYGNMVNGNFRLQPFSNNQQQQEEGEGEGGEGGEGRNNANDTRGNVANSILQFLSAMTGGTLGEGLAGNPNDYVFSQTALDNIITQLMEQAGGGSAPPPAPEQVIESLPKRELTEKEKSQEADCAVCKDAFDVTEKVIQLPCEHIFHDDCIKPWLKLNSTCPVCRKSVLPEQPVHTTEEERHDLDLD
ncbi:hypothetical protein G6F57_010151 [Rhizopus arrhizus]|uniref:RING-type E3 ubiquitin transferase n=1 Tax=Rhizopus oryzae TaxID=64495 RepID=A0A9P6X134_RHIOR|nr:hypothetical protein G6F23_007095 [Rhizopus arrhizus]KAG1412069.1 hypothetical protein G6F58_008213 [Rhizopus delemar]KAG0757380.1 hypothetical protein G6F24_010517 [Rhizopus arrhizus]KAG0783279.1 hypothetical protein G6F21_010633 [Rhizopus arrhizus]KAG0792922.1 hypothetical protein G6F22_005737 [Rhizopus arrhizus]